MIGRRRQSQLTVFGGAFECGLAVRGSEGVPDEAAATPQVVLPVVEAPELPGPAAGRQRYHMC